MLENPVFDLKIKHFLAVHGGGDEQFCGYLEFYTNHLKKIMPHWWRRKV